jgi:outer membrane protein assembly factor BamB
MLKIVPLLVALVLVGAACGSVAQPQGWSAPLLQGDTLYLSPERGKFAAYQLDAGRTSRERLWLFPQKDEQSAVVVEDGEDLAAPKNVKLKFEAFYGAPVLKDGHLYLSSYSGHLMALSTEGRPRWVAGLPGRVIGGVLVTDDTVYSGTTRGEVYALARDTGKVRWRQKLDEPVWSAPVQAGDGIAVADMGGAITAFDKDGNRRWSEQIAARGIASTPKVDGGRLYFGSLDKRLYAVDAANGSVVWRSDEADNWFWTEVLIQDDTLFAGSLSGTVFAIEKGSGATRWSNDIGATVRGRAALVDGVLVVASKDGRIHGLEPASGNRVWETKGSTGPTDPLSRRGSLYADLLVLDNGILAARVGGKQGNVYVLDVSTRQVREVVPR